AEGYRQRGLYRSAEKRYQEAVAADANHGPAYLGLARLAASRGDAAGKAFSPASPLP
ncbi:MAG: hypothetical protein HUU23_18250, partial [Caldilineales bacterium]|nr:hypothetical protein [Caldilineales bacterium]